MTMKYDFTSIVDRSSDGSDKWAAMKRIRPDVPAGIVPLSVADMEFPNPPQITEGLREFLRGRVLGYTGPTDAYYESVIRWMQRRHGFTPARESFVLSPGVVPVLDRMAAAFTRPGERVLLLTPVYYPFFRAAEKSGREWVSSPLVPAGRSYEIDFADFEEKARDPRVTLCILSSPHNPVGKVFTQEELRRLADICLDNGVFVICDEIHSDIILPGYTHVSMASLGEKYLNNCAVCTAPSKTFNLAGLQVSNTFVHDPARREKLAENSSYSSLNIFAYEACRLAYDLCEDWLEEFLQVIDGNRRLLEEFCTARLPGVKVCELQGTYLAWVDFRCLGLTPAELEKLMTEKALLFLDEGYIFGREGEGFERINLACPRSTLEAALERLAAAIG